MKTAFVCIRIVINTKKLQQIGVRSRSYLKKSHCTKLPFYMVLSLRFEGNFMSNHFMRILFGMIVVSSILLRRALFLYILSAFVTKNEYFLHFVCVHKLYTAYMNANIRTRDKTHVDKMEHSSWIHSAFEYRLFHIVYSLFSLSRFFFPFFVCLFVFRPCFPPHFNSLHLKAFGFLFKPQLK